jgi:hypothetical protein
MSNQEQKVPSKQEIIAFMQEQIDVKKVQVELQELNTKLAKGRAEELQALSFIGNLTNPQGPATKPHIITEEDMVANPELKEAGVQVGDEVLIPADESQMPMDAPSERKLKKN